MQSETLPTVEPPRVPTPPSPTERASSSSPQPESSQEKSPVDTNAATTKEGFVPRAKTHLKTEIALAHTDIPLIACCFVSGLCDSSAYNAWTCFVSMQTGNTVFLALGVSGQPSSHPYGWLKSFLSICFFLTGSLFFSRLGRFLGLRRGLFTISFLAQSISLIIAASLVQATIVPSPEGIATGEGDMDFMELLPLAFLAFQSGGQMVASRLLGVAEVPTTVLTSVYCDLLSDPAILAPWGKNLKRNRRVGAILCVLIGAICGGWLSRSNAGMSVALWLAAFVKLMIAVAFFNWKGKE